MLSLHHDSGEAIPSGCSNHILDSCPHRANAAAIGRLVRPMHVDANQHFWIYSPVAYDWIDDSMVALRGDFLPKNLKPELESNDFQGSVAVQTRARR